MLSLRLAVVLAGMILAIACGGDYSSPPTAPSPAPSPTPASGPPPSSVTIPVRAEVLGNRAFMPAELNVAVGTTVNWVNADSTSHTSTSDVTRWNSGAIAPGGRFSVSFLAGGTFPYHCTIHPGMAGTVVVR